MYIDTLTSRSTSRLFTRIASLVLVVGLSAFSGIAVHAQTATAPTTAPTTEPTTNPASPSAKPSTNLNELPDPVIGSVRPLLSRPEPHLEAGAEALNSGDGAGAIQKFRGAKAETPDEKAVIEYNVAQALLADALKNRDPKNESNKKQYDEAIQALKRAQGLARTPSLKSEAALSEGNAHAAMQDLDGAINALRRAVVADPNNQRAMENLRSVLSLQKRQQQQQQQQQQDKKDQQDKQDKQDQQQDQQNQQNQQDKNDDKQEQQKQDQQNQQNQQDKNDDKQEQQKQQDQQNQQNQQNQDDKKQQQQQNQAGQDPPKDGKTAPAQGQKPNGQNGNDEARQLLDSLRDREKPLSPMQMQPQQNRSAPAKDW